jgi:hypothetical protein
VRSPAQADQLERGVHDRPRMNTTTEPRDGIEQLREILVGAIQRDLERKLARIESQITSRLAELQQETRRRSDVIEGHLRKESDALAARLESEVVEIKESLRTMSRDHSEATSAIEKRVTKLEEGLSRAQHDLRAQILDQAKEFLDEVHATRKELAALLDRELASLEGDTDESRSRGPYEAGPS